MKNIILIALILFIPCSVFPGEMILHENEKTLIIFYTQSDNNGWESELRGKIIFIGTDNEITRDLGEEARQKDLSEKIHENTSAVVRLYNTLGINIGDTLYTINGKNLITGKLLVISIFESKTFGCLLTAKGDLSLASPGERVVQRSRDVSEKAYLYNSRADYHSENGREGEAIKNYKNALDKDKGNPEAHISLGYIYLNKFLHQLAMSEFIEAEKNSARIYDNEDKYLLYKGMCEVRFNEAYYTGLPDNLRNKYIKEGIEYSLKALAIFPDSKEVNYYLGVFYYKNTDPEDVKARDQFLKVVRLDDTNIDAFLALAELYEKHNNRERAFSYAEKALSIDPANDRAKYLFQKLR